MRRGRGLRWTIAAVMALSGSIAQAADPAPHAAPVNPDATPEARALLSEIYAISGRATLTGEHNFPNHLSRWSDRIYDLTNKFPAVFGQDFGFAGGDDKDSVEGRPAMIEEAERQYRQGAIIALTWHAVRPTDDEPVTFRDSVQGHLTDFEWNELLTPGTALYNRWAQQVDEIAGYLRQLEAAGVPVLFRPYHEMNGNWFWWGGRPGEHGSAALYRQIYDRFVRMHHLNNLVWVWNVNSPSQNAGPVAEYYPGPSFADVVTMDIYGEFRQDYYSEMLALAGDKPIALAEVGAMPSLKVIEAQPRWAYFMMWSGLAELANSPEQLRTNFHAPNLLNRGDAPFSAHAAGPAGEILPATPEAQPAVKATLQRLLDARGRCVLDGQRNDAAAPEGAAQAVYEETSKYPAVYEADLGVAAHSDRTQGLVDEVMRQSRAKSVVGLRWLPPSPADPGDAPEQKSPEARLTDFEWRELMAPGTHLNQRWGAQVDRVAAVLKQLDDQGVAVLWTPYPDGNGRQYWWAGRSGTQGSAALYRMLFERLVSQHHLHNLVWVWEALPAGLGAGSNGAYSGYFPGLLYVDALNLRLSRTQSPFRSDVALGSLAVGKPIGVSIDGPAPSPEFFARETGWSWFVLAPEAAAERGSASAVRVLYSDPHVQSR